MNKTEAGWMIKTARVEPDKTLPGRFNIVGEDFIGKVYWCGPCFSYPNGWTLHHHNAVIFGNEQSAQKELMPILLTL